MNKFLENELIRLKTFGEHRPESESLQVIFTFNDGLSLHEIERFQKSIGLTFPKEYVSFLQFTNGCTLYNYEDLDGFMFFDLEKSIEETHGLAEVYEEKWKYNILIICSVLGDGDFIGIKIFSDGYEILDCFHEDNPDEWRKISDSLDEFLQKLISRKGEKFWL